MTELPSTTVGSISELTDDVVARAIATLQDKLPQNELKALQELVVNGTFLSKGAILSAISQSQAREAI